MWSCERVGAKIEVSFHGSLKGFYNLLPEPYCKRCSEIGVNGRNCSWCEDLYGFEKIRVVGIYQKDRELREDILSNHIWGLKMKAFRNYAEPLGKALAILLTDVAPELAKIDAMVPVPLHPDKIAKRGFNQADEVAHIAGVITGQPVLPALRKTRDVSMSVVPSREGRKQAVRGLYEYSAGNVDIGGKSILLIDDVITTGFNVSECSSILLKSGARKVCVAALARNALS